MLVLTINSTSNLLIFSNSTSALARVELEKINKLRVLLRVNTNINVLLMLNYTYTIKRTFKKKNYGEKKLKQF